MKLLPLAFEALHSYAQFIIYKLEPSKTRLGKTDKFPINHNTGNIANAHDPSIWMDSKTALVKVDLFGAQFGLGFVLTEDDPFWFLDIDDCVNDTAWSPVAQELMAHLKGAAIEISSSRRGLHILGSGKVPAHSCKNKNFNLEFYNSGRFVALTGILAIGSIAKDCSKQLIPVINKYFTPSQNNEIKKSWTNTAEPSWRGPLDDAVLIERALKSQSTRAIFGTKASFTDLWNRNEDILNKTYPDIFRNRGYDESSADAALAQHLAFWTGNNCERILNLMRQSKLVRDKWEREDYLPRTILNATSLQKEWLIDKESQTKIIPKDLSTLSIVTGNTFLSIEQQIEFFKGCSYICDLHKVLVPGGYLLKPDQFQVMYGGYSFLMDSRNEKISRNAWEAFTQSQAFRAPRADSSCFKPDLEAGKIYELDNRRLANIWWPINTPRRKGDLQPFLTHLEKSFPNKRDRTIFLSFMAACVQYKGIKFQWAPLLQGVEGNGKTFFTRCVAFAIGERYVHFPKASEIDSRFNDWMYSKIFIGVEDIFTPDSRLEVIEALKPMITSDKLEIEAKHGTKVTLGVCCNFIINTNHKDGLRKTRNDRRFAPFFTPQQSAADLTRDGMTSDYFFNLYSWAKNNYGFEIVSEFLHTFEIPEEFNPATKCQRAPFTSSTLDAINQSLTHIEQEILEAIAQGLVGFKNGWVSSMAIDRLLERLQIGRRIPHSKRRDILQALGYDWHPNLPDGRVNNTVLPDGGKPRLYIKSDNIALKLIDPVEIAKAYSLAQQ